MSPFLGFTTTDSSAPALLKAFPPLPLPLAGKATCLLGVKGLSSCSDEATNLLLRRQHSRHDSSESGLRAGGIGPPIPSWVWGLKSEIKIAPQHSLQSKRNVNFLPRCLEALNPWQLSYYYCYWPSLRSSELSGMAFFPFPHLHSLPPLSGTGPRWIYLSLLASPLPTAQASNYSFPVSFHQSLRTPWE